MIPPAGKHLTPQRKKLMIYGGVAAALLLVVLLARRGSAPATGADQSQLTPVASPAPDMSGSGSLDNGSQLADFESALLDQLPQALQGLVSTAPSSTPPLTINVGSSTGAQTGPGAGAASGSPAPATKPIVHPATAIAQALATPGKIAAATVQAAIPTGTSAARADSGVVRNGVDIGLLDSAMALVLAKGTKYKAVQRSTMAERIRAHPDWGPYTLANGGAIAGHSTRF